MTRRNRKLTGTRKKLFLNFWDAFAFKEGKAEAADAWLDIDPFSESIAGTIINAAKTEAAKRERERKQGRSPKMAQGWINARRWEDEALNSTAGADNDNLETKSYGSSGGRQGFAKARNAQDG